MPRIYSPIVPGKDDESQYPVKSHALLDHERGVPITELPEVWASSESSLASNATIGNDHAATAISVGTPIDLTRDAVNILWYRAGRLMYRLVLGVYDILRPPAVNPGTTLTDSNSQSFGETVAGEHRGFRLGRKSDNSLLIQQDSSATVTLNQGDEIRVFTSIYEGGVLGGKFRKLKVPQNDVIWLKIRSATQPTAPTGVTYSGTASTLPQAVMDAGWVLMSDADPTGNNALWYARADATYDYDTETWTVSAFTVLGFPADNPAIGLELTFSATETGTRHAPPQVATDQFAHFRVTPDGTRRTVRIVPAKEDPFLFGTSSTAWIPITSSNTTDLVFSNPVDLDSYGLMVITCRTLLGATNQVPMFIPTYVIDPQTSTSYSWIDSKSWWLHYNSNGVSYLQGDDDTAPSGGFQNFAFYPYRNVSDDRRRVRGLRLFSPTDQAGSGGVLLRITFH